MNLGYELLSIILEATTRGLLPPGSLEIPVEYEDSGNRALSLLESDTDCS